MRHSCGAILYTKYNNKIYVILGKESYRRRSSQPLDVRSTKHRYVKSRHINADSSHNWRHKNRQVGYQRNRSKSHPVHKMSMYNSDKLNWFPFKGTVESGESYNEAAIREIHEETMGIVKCDSIELTCNFATKYKHYHIGLVEVKNTFVDEFFEKQDTMVHMRYDKPEIFEKSHVCMFSITELETTPWHNITFKIIRFFLPELKLLESSL